MYKTQYLFNLFNYFIMHEYANVDKTEMCNTQ